MRISWFLVTTIVASLSLGCDGLSAGADERGDGIYDSFMGALTAEYGVSEGDTVTTGVLHLVNTASFETLDIDAALNARA